jgi:hypothetical protein
MARIKVKPVHVIFIGFICLIPAVYQIDHKITGLTNDIANLRSEIATIQSERILLRPYPVARVDTKIVHDDGSMIPELNNEKLIRSVIGPWPGVKQTPARAPKRADGKDDDRVYLDLFWVDLMKRMDERDKK